MDMEGTDWTTVQMGWIGIRDACLEMCSEVCTGVRQLILLDGRNIKLYRIGTAFGLLMTDFDRLPDYLEMILN